jgi:ankyrin repeat protein
MNKLNPEIFSHMAAYLDESALDTLSLMYQTLIEKTKKKPLYWHERVEILLKHKLLWKSTDWENIYNLLKTAISYSAVEAIPLLSAVILLNEEGGQFIADIVAILLESGYNPTVNQYEETNALIIAIKTDNLETAKLLLIDDRIDTSANNNSPILLASGVNINLCGQKIIDIIKLLLKDVRTNPSDQDNLALINAAIFGYAEIIELLLTDTRVNPLSENNKAIKSAVINGRLVSVIKLIQNSKVKATMINKIEADIKKPITGLNEMDIGIEWMEALNELNTRFDDAYFNGDINVVKLLLSNPKINFRKSSGIILASQCGHKDIVKLLLKDGRVDPSYDRNFAARYASNNGYIDIVELLLADDRVNIFGWRKYYSKALNNPIFTNLIKKKVKDSLSGLAAIYSHESFNSIIRREKLIDIYTLPNNWRYTSDISTFIMKFLRDLIRNKIPLVKVIIKLDQKIQEEGGSIRKTIGYSVKYILDRSVGMEFELKNVVNWDIERWYLYCDMIGFFLLTFEPKYTLYELINIINEISINDIITFETMKLISAHLGLSGLIERGLNVTEKMNKNIEKILSFDIGLLFD